MGYNRTLGHFTNSQELATIWASGQNYIVDQLVLDSDKLYRCNTAHTSGATFAGDSAYWTGINPGATIGIAEGGTGQTTATAAFDALAPTTTAGDLIVHNGTDNVRLPVGTDGQMIVADSSQTNKLKWATVPQGSKNYITYSNFENNTTTGWSLFNTTLDANKIPNGAITAGPPVTNPLSALAVSASSPLAGSYSLSVTSTGSINAAQGFITDVLTIDREDQAKVLTFSFYYEALTTNMNFSGTSSNTWAIYIHDGTNWIQPAGVYGMTQSSGAGLVTGTFQTNATGTSYRVAVICINGTSGAVSMRFDDFKLGPQTAPIGPVMTDTVNAGAITIGATVTAPTKGTTTADFVSWMRIGDSAYFSYQYNQTGAGTAGSGDYLISLPAGMSFDSNKVSFYTGGLVNFSALVPYGLPDAWFGWGQSPGTNSYGLIIPYDSTRFRVAFEYVTASGPAGAGGVFWGSIGNQLSYATVSFNATFQVPISGWSSNVQLSNDTDTRVVDFRAYTTSARTVNNTAPTIIFENVDKDSHGAYNASTGVYTVPVSGDYVVSGQMRIGSLTMTAGAFFGFSAAVDGVYTVRHHYTAFRAVTTSSAFNFAEGSGSVLLPNLRAGQTIQVRAWGDNATATFTDGANTFCIQRISGPSVVAASETVAASYWGNSAQLIPNGIDSVCVSTPSRVYDTHNMWSAGSGYNSGTGTWTTRPGFTIPVSGKYLITFSCGIALPASLTLGTLWAEMGHLRGASIITTAAGNRASGNFSDTFSSSGSAIIQANAGDFVGLFTFQSSGASRNTNTESRHTRIEIVRVGN